MIKKLGAWGIGPMVSGATGPAWARPFQFACDFRSGFVRLGGRRVTMAAIDSYHSRASARRAEDSAGVSREFGNGVMAVTDRGYDSREGWTVLNADPLNPRAWSIEGGGTRVDAPGGFLGLSSAALYASGGLSYQRLRSVIPNDAIVAGASYAVRARYFAGSSPWARVHLRCVTTAQDVQVKGPVGALAVSATSAGSVSNLINLDLGGGVFECSFVTTITATGSVWHLALGPDSDVAGQTIGIVAAQITPTAYQMPWGSGTVAPDSLVIPAADAGLAVDPSVTGLTMVWRGRCFETFTTFAPLVEVSAPQTAGGSNSFMFQYRKGQNFRADLTANGVTTTRAMGGAFAEDRAFVMTWRPDGTARVVGAGEAYTVTRALQSVLANNISIGCRPYAAGATNAQIHLAAIGGFALPDDAALNLFNAVAAA